MKIRHPYHKDSSAFSLVELMCSVAIISILASFAIQGMDTFVVRARNTEAAMNLGIAMSLATSYFDGDRDNYKLGQELTALSRNDFTTATSCRTDPAIIENAIGFNLNNCTKTNFVYALGVDHAARTFGVYAVEGGTVGNKRVNKKCRGTSYWVNNKTMGLRHTVDTLDPVACNTCFHAYLTPKLGGTDLTFDADGNGLIQSHDINSVPGYMQTAIVYGTPMTYLFSCP